MTASPISRAWHCGRVKQILNYPCRDEGIELPGETPELRQTSTAASCAIPSARRLISAPSGSHYPRRPPPQRQPTTLQRTHHTTRRPALQETTRKGLKPGDKKHLSIGVVLPYSTFHRRSYVKAIKSALFQQMQAQEYQPDQQTYTTSVLLTRRCFPWTDQPKQREK
ncbi:hypothetical protein GWK47_046235 [Chionoecetes opilio]|uniref:Uncharacterized protein n=1 Tax=Chionoecetes opilio TaxID=41210 RepID=A0A8J4YET6_CHIOP|nr:hypothetical protein GWK47_046235 [Chionoecetes opilio]